MEKKYSNSVKIRYPPSEKKLIKLLKQNVNDLVDKVPTIKKIILFGSYSRRDYHYGSDVDLLVIVKKRISNDFEEIYSTLFQISLEYDWAPIIITETHFKEQKEQNSYFIKEIINKGIVICSKE